MDLMIIFEQNYFSDDDNEEIVNFFLATTILNKYDSYYFDTIRASLYYNIDNNDISLAKDEMDSLGIPYQLKILD